MSNLKQRFLTSLLIAPFVLFLTYLGELYFVFLLLLIFLLGFYEISLIKKNIIKILILLIFIIFLYSFYNIRISENGLDKILTCFLITWTSDIGGFCFGKIIGGKKINFISPNKTYSGFIGALFLPQILIFYLKNIEFFFNKTLSYYFLIVFFLSLATILGDLFFSYLKRVIKIKDYSNLLPGHGGVFDRVDGLIFVTIIFFLIT